MKFIFSPSRPEKSWNFSEGRGKSWKSNMLLENKQQKDKNLKKKIADKSAKAFISVEKDASTHFNAL